MNILLLPISLAYRFGCQIKNLLYNWKMLKAKKVPLPIISIGNISFGGSEKTPLAMNLISRLLKLGYNPALITRGYKGNWEKHGGILSDGNSILGDWKDSGDEPFMIAQSFPESGIFIGKNRLDSCKKAIDLGFNVAIMDDGFQHRGLHRDLDIVLYSPSERIALREPVSSLKRAHILLTKTDTNTQTKQDIKKRFPQVAHFEYSVINKGIFRLGEKKVDPSIDLKKKKVLAFCGIARSERFASLLEREGIKAPLILKFPDHHSYPPSSLRKIVKKYNHLKAEAIITTEKDAVKIAALKDFKNIPVFYLKIDIKVAEDFYERIYSLIKKK